MKGHIDLSNTIHQFKKENLVSLPGGGDKYKCQCCGIIGWRNGFSPMLEIRRASKEKFHNCDGKRGGGTPTPPQAEATTSNQKPPAGTKRLFMVMENSYPIHGFPKGKEGQVLEQCEPPAKYRGTNGLWVMGDEPFMVYQRELDLCLEEVVEVSPGEYEFLN